MATAAPWLARAKGRILIGTWLEGSRSSAEELAQAGREPGIDDPTGGEAVAEDRLRGPAPLGRGFPAPTS